LENRRATNNLLHLNPPYKAEEKNTLSGKRKKWKDCVDHCRPSGRRRDETSASSVTWNKPGTIRSIADPADLEQRQVVLRMSCMAGLGNAVQTHLYRVGIRPMQKRELSTLVMSYYRRLVPVMPRQVCRKCQDSGENAGLSASRIQKHQPRREGAVGGKSRQASRRSTWLLRGGGGQESTGQVSSGGQ
jgi:hypothetical protein